jgi:hypothetical protein
MRNLKSSPLSRELSLKKLNSAEGANGDIHARKGKVYFELSSQIAPGRGI